MVAVGFETVSCGGVDYIIVDFDGMCSFSFGNLLLYLGYTFEHMPTLNSP